MLYLLLKKPWTNCACAEKNNYETLTSGKSGILIGFGTMNVQHNDTPYENFWKKIIENWLWRDDKCIVLEKQ